MFFLHCQFATYFFFFFFLSDKVRIEKKKKKKKECFLLLTLPLRISCLQVALNSEFCSHLHNFLFSIFHFLFFLTTKLTTAFGSLVI